MLCTQHHQLLDEEMGYCWKCLAQERDPYGLGRSWWWHLEPEVPEATEVEEARDHWRSKAA